MRRLTSGREREKVHDEDDDGDDDDDDDNFWAALVQTCGIQLGFCVAGSSSYLELWARAVERLNLQWGSNGWEL